MTDAAPSRWHGLTRGRIAGIAVVALLTAALLAIALVRGCADGPEPGPVEPPAEVTTPSPGGDGSRHSRHNGHAHRHGDPLPDPFPDRHVHARPGHRGRHLGLSRRQRRAPAGGDHHHLPRSPDGDRWRPLRFD